MADASQQDPKPAAETLRWDRILAWQPRLTFDEGGRWVQPDRQSDGVFPMGYVAFSATAEAFLATLYDERVVAGFDWPSWMEHRGGELAANRELLGGASLEDCRRLLAALVRADRFNEGALLGAFEDGLVDAILGRIRRLMAIR
jgi:hypothetical protein